MVIKLYEQTRNSIANDRREITTKYPKKSYCSFAGHNDLLCSRSFKFQPNSFNTVQFTERAKIAFSYVTSGII